VTTLRRGFKAEAECLAIELREEIGLSPRDRLDPQMLADLYGIPAIDLCDLDVDPRHIAQLTGPDSGAWSALTVFDGTRRKIVLNDGHDPRRLANSFSHELAHLFLEHTPKPVRNLDGSRTWNRTMEEEANELAAQLLIPTCTARILAYRGHTAEQVADMYGVSTELARWRLRISGGNRIRQRAAARRRDDPADLRP
jgi:hypothetical protein